MTLHLSPVSYLINDTIAALLSYGITKFDLPEPENLHHVVFVDLGHSSLSVTAVAFSKGQLIIKNTTHDEIDYALVKHFSDEFKAKFNIDAVSILVFLYMKYDRFVSCSCLCLGPS